MKDVFILALTLQLHEKKEEVEKNNISAPKISFPDSMVWSCSSSWNKREEVTQGVMTFTVYAHILCSIWLVHFFLTHAQLYINIFFPELLQFGFRHSARA